MMQSSDTAPTVQTDDEAALLAAVTRALWVWDTLRLELGEVAVITDGHPESRLVALVATWSGATPALFVTDNPSGLPAGVTPVAGAADADAAAVLGARFKVRPGVAAADLSGRAEVVDVLLEALPKSARLLLAGTAREPITLDYYNNVHRKGLRLVSVNLESEAVSAAPDAVARRERAERLLARPARRQTCRAALGHATGGPR